MFYYISGPLVLLEPNMAVVEAGGVGYKLTISQTTYEQMPPRLTAKEPPKVKLLTHLAVREDDVELFGFYSQEELSAFKMLISVSGVGPKVAMSVLSLMTPEKFAMAVCTEDTKAISKASGVGAKTAARIVLELKDKLTKGGGAIALGGGNQPVKTGTAGASQGGNGSVMSEALDALMVLGYTRPEAMNALTKVAPGTSLEESIRLALKQLMKNG